MWYCQDSQILSGDSPTTGGALVEYDELVEYYRRKLMERYVAYTNRDLVQRIIYLLSSADPDTLAVILGLLQSKN